MNYRHVNAFMAAQSEVVAAAENYRQVFAMEPPRPNMRREAGARFDAARAELVRCVDQMAGVR